MTPRAILIAAAGLSALTLSGCGGTPNRGLESVHQPVVGRTDYSLDLGTDGRGLAYGEAARLSGWLDGMRVAYGDRVAVDDPTGSGGARTELAAALAARGLLVQPGAPVTPGAIQPGTVRVVLSRMRASVPGCPDYSRDLSNEFESNTSSGYGCAVNASLAAMIANPADLVRGHDGATTADPRQLNKTIDAYRAAAPSGGGGQNVRAEKAGSK